jgi:hypothetical protein
MSQKRALSWVFNVLNNSKGKMGKGFTKIKDNKIVKISR